MADNTYVNKVVYDNTTLIDLTSDTAVASDVTSGKTFHLASGAVATGTAIPTGIFLSDATDIANITVTRTKTKGVAPYNTNYYYTNITVDTDEVGITESDLDNGIMFCIMLTSSISSSYRNVRIQFGESGTYFPLMGEDGEICSGYNAFNDTYEYRSIIYTTAVIATGAFHINYDKNSTYTPASLGFGYATCDTAEATTDKVATLTSGSYGLGVNGIVAVQFTYAVPADSTLDVATKGAKPIYYNGSAITAGIIKAGDVATFMYDGTNYNLITIDTTISGKESKGKVTISGTESTVVTHTLTITDSGTTTSYTLLGI